MSTSEFMLRAQEQHVVWKRLDPSLVENSTMRMYSTTCRVMKEAHHFCTVGDYLKKVGLDPFLNNVR